MKKLNDQVGTSLLEMVLFTPLALMIIFLGTDSALRFVEMAGVNDAIRSALKAEVENFNDRSLFQTSLDGTINIDEASLSQATNGVAQRISNQISQTKASLPNATREDYFIEVTPISVPVQSTGRLETSSLNLHSAASFNSNAQDSVSSSEINEILELSQSNPDSPSSYSIAIGPDYQASASELRFFDMALFLYVRVRGQTSGISPGNNWATGNLFEVDESQLIPLRTISQ